MAQVNRSAQLHIRVTPDQLARFQLAAEGEGKTLSLWAVELLTAAASPDKKGGRRKSAQRRPNTYNYGYSDDDEG